MQQTTHSIALRKMILSEITVSKVFIWFRVAAHPELFAEEYIAAWRWRSVRESWIDHAPTEMTMSRQASP